MISFTAEVLGIRDDIFLGEGHKYMLEVAAAVEEGFREGVLAHSARRSSIFSAISTTRRNRWPTSCTCSKRSARSKPCAARKSP